ncbi:DUF4837 domain-containing protein [Flavobacterium cyanobacteriorum]|uniref:DUF4837 domain-containing protein n=1 Tax=Flavobacterium cyanobacteriorum TaxID=2022802 RepID=A0A255Z0F6_9FLAO|nr:DUF4837 family protein [Flavobacterium cyanobacteriorum]OYQ34424.1 DUF4837 domain-containing protein [Flavobacterium cyanobacteriorum]
MKRLKQIIVLVFVIFFIACKSDEHNAAASTGNINEIAVVISDVLWNGEVGDTIRKRLAAPVDGLTMEEPIFTLNQFNHKVFTGSLSKGRNIVLVEKGTTNNFTYRHNATCTPQNVFTITGKSVDDLLHLIEMHADEVIMKIRDTEITEYQDRHKKTGLLGQSLFTPFGIKASVPKTYTLAMRNEDFLWLKKDIPSGNTSLVIYKVPYEVVEKDKTLINNLIKMRDSVGNMYIHGQEPGTYMKTEEAYSPYIFMTSFRDKRAFETRGNWEMENDFMDGPFLNYAIRDDKHQCYLIIEGFIYSPSSPKRDLLVELEAIIKSVRFI